MPETIKNPVLVTDVTGPGSAEFSTVRAFLVLASLSEPVPGELIRLDIATLALLYGSHFSPVHAPFEVDRVTLYALENKKLLTCRWNAGPDRVKIVLHKA